MTDWDDAPLRGRGTPQTPTQNRFHCDGSEMRADLQGDARSVRDMGLTFVTTKLTPASAQGGEFEAQFLVDTRATDSIVPGHELKRIGLAPVGNTAYEMADGTLHRFNFGLARIEFMGEITAGRVIFGPDSCEPILGVTALESVGILVDPANKTLKRLPAIPMK